MENARVSRAMGTFYDVLGVRRDSAADEIKQAYHRLALEYHPDKNSSSAAAEKMKEINEAYRVLGDAKLRAEYDAKAFRSAGDNLYARWYRPSPGGFKQGPGTTGRHAWAESAEAASMGYEAPRRTTVYKSAAFISREHLVASAKVGLAFGIAIAFLILSADTIQQKYGVGVIVSLAAATATAFLTSFVSVLLLRDELKNKAEAGVSGSAALAVALFMAWLAWAFFYSGTGPDWGWCMTCFGAPVLCGIAGWLIGRFVGQRTWDVFRG